MDSNFKNDSVIVVRRASRNNRNSHHGGAWKIAFADFAMSLLCLFFGVMDHELFDSPAVSEYSQLFSPGCCFQTP